MRSARRSSPWSLMLRLQLQNMKGFLIQQYKLYVCCVLHIELAESGEGMKDC